MSTTRQPWCLQVRIVHLWVEGENITYIVKILPSERQLMTHTSVRMWYYGGRSAAAWKTTTAEDNTLQCRVGCHHAV